MPLEDTDIDRIAHRIVELLRAEQTTTPAASVPAAPVRLVDATTIARALGVTREWVYLHAQQLGAVRLGGPKGRLRFDLQTIASNGREPDRPTGPPEPPVPGRRGPWLSREHGLKSQPDRFIKRPGSVGAPPARHRED